MVDSNLQRENILPSERAQAYKMKLEAVAPKRGSCRGRKKLCSSLSTISLGSGALRLWRRNRAQIQRYIRLTELSAPTVDAKKIAPASAVEISYLTPEEQSLLKDTIASA